MEIVRLPFGLDPQAAERAAIRRGLASASAKPFLWLIDTDPASGRFCAGCAAPIDSGIVWRQQEAYCSVECSLGGNRPA